MGILVRIEKIFRWGMVWGEEYDECELVFCMPDSQ